ncbi:transcription factor Ouib [Drosophila serrata]|uniref:transcription factor Ouib n=1 Tax=Drosophila serrata TaxID=7274 RepID=UPI000A1D372F|nr:transcription factor Ouib [Drosophila serrata]
MQPKLCRACGKCTNVERSINMFEELNQSILEHLTLLTGVSFENCTVLPNLLCIYCQIRTSQAISFRERCLEVQRELLESLSDKDLLQIPDDYRRIFEPEDHSIQSQISMLIEGVEDEDGADYDASFKEFLSEPDHKEDSHPRTFASREDEDNNDIYSAKYQHISENDEEKEEVLIPTQKSANQSRRRKPVKSDGIFICDECGKHFKGEKSFKFHCNRHRGVKNYGCELCKDSFCTTSELRRHMRRHTGEKPFACRHCFRCFSDYSSRLKHERTHTNTRPFSCKECGHAFYTAYVLKNHMLIHTGKRAFRCDPCDKSFSRDVHLTAHYRSKAHKLKVKEGTNLPSGNESDK